MSYGTRLTHNYFELSRLQQIRYRLLDRRRLPERDRLFFEGCPSIPGQMYLADRRAIYDTIVALKPAHCFEIGTYTGGGSTFFLASAFADIGSGSVVTLELDPTLFTAAKHAYETHLPHLLPFTRFLEGNTPDMFLPFIEQAGGTVDAFLLDGAENADETLVQFEFFSRFLRSGSILMAHDWRTEKMAGLAPHIENDPAWNIIAQLDEPQSVGFVVCRYK